MQSRHAESIKFAKPKNDLMPDRKLIFVSRAGLHAVSPVWGGFPVSSEAKLHSVPLIRSGFPIF